MNIPEIEERTLPLFPMEVWSSPVLFRNALYYHVSHTLTKKAAESEAKTLKREGHTVELFRKRGVIPLWGIYSTDPTLEV